MSSCYVVDNEEDARTLIDQGAGVGIVHKDRKLVTVRRISELTPIEGADNIVCATVDGWKLVTQKSNGFQPGDLVIYFEIDSFLPEVEGFEFLRKSSYKRMGDVGGFRLRTIKLRGQVSQGLILPLSETDMIDVEGVDLIEGTDLTEYFGVVKWDPPVPAALAGKAKGNFPSFIRKTDQERIQNCFGSLFETYETTIKLDGSSMTVFNRIEWTGEPVDYHSAPMEKKITSGVCSRNLELVETEGNAFWTVARESGLLDALKTLDHSYAVQGELMGPGIQGNRENLKTNEFYVYDIFDIDRSRYLTPYERKIIFDLLVERGAKIKHVPIIDTHARLQDFMNVQAFLDYAERPSINHPIAEGVVFKSNRTNGHTFKVISNTYLLKSKD